RLSPGRRTMMPVRCRRVAGSEQRRGLPSDQRQSTSGAESPPLAGTAERYCNRSVFRGVASPEGARLGVPPISQVLLPLSLKAGAALHECYLGGATALDGKDEPDRRVELGAERVLAVVDQRNRTLPDELGREPTPVRCGHREVP